MKQSPGVLSLCYRLTGKDLTSLSGNYDDDLLRAAPLAYPLELEKSLRFQFECSLSQELPTDFLGYGISRSHRSLHAVMKKYIARLEALSMDSVFRH